VSRDRLDFLIIGAQKAGTTSAYAHLAQHPTIELGRNKELHFFDNDEHFAVAGADYTPYHERFEWRQGKVRGECTPIYLYWDGCLERIRDYNSDIRLVCMLRNPVERAFSQYSMEISRGTAQGRLCLSLEEERDLSGGQAQHRVYSYLSRGMYASQMRRLFDLFPRENVLALKYEDYRNDNQSAMNELFRFLGVAPMLIEKRDVFKTEYASELSTDDYNTLVDVFAQDVAELEALLNWDCADWLRKK